ncbi:MAG: glycosyltransferase family 4 protein [Deltaproteobacteria bacterium]|nr:glycosyltransferase family 4 protein [Deltaproteobacteria bacterium]
MNKVLVFCSDVVPLEGLGTSGGGLRSWQIIQGLQSAGLEVVYSMPWNRFLRREFKDNIPSDAAERLWTDSNQDEIIEKEKPDVIVCAKPSTKKWAKNHEIPLAIDFHGPDLIEFEQMAKVFLPEARFSLATRKLQSIAQGDFFTCAGRRQRYYFMAFLMMAGVDITDLEIHYMPVAMSPRLPEHTPDLDRRSIVFSGGFYPWLNPIPALRSLAEELQKKRMGHLDIYGGSHETNPEDKREFEAFRREISKNPFVTFHGFVPREEVIEQYRKAYVAFELMPGNAEREMAFTTRTVEFMWAGLPVIYNDYAELSDLIRTYKAGWLVPPTDFQALSKVIEEVLDDPHTVARASKNAQRLVRENLVYDPVIRPLAEFCKRPRFRQRSGDSHFLVIPTISPRYGLIDDLYLHYRRLPFRGFLKTLFTAAVVLTKNRLQNKL